MDFKKTLMIVFLLSFCGRKFAPPGKPDIDPPEVMILSPSHNSFVAGSTRVEVSVKDKSKIVFSELFVDENSIGKDSFFPYEFYFVPRDSIHRLRALAMDKWDNTGYSPLVNVFLPESLLPKKDTLKDTLKQKRLETKEK